MPITNIESISPPEALSKWDITDIITDTQPELLVLSYEDLLNGNREYYFNICVPLYQASSRCSWDGAKVILDQYPYLMHSNLQDDSAYEAIAWLHAAAGLGRKGTLPLKGTPTVMKTEQWDSKDVETSSKTSPASISSQVMAADEVLSTSNGCSIQENMRNLLPALKSLQKAIT
ncbi:hypothetical protein Tco_0282583, partial [Tanacetum coccineum]